MNNLYTACRLTVGGQSSTDMKNELTRLQPWLKIADIIKIKDHTHVFKVRSSDSDSTTRLLADGLKTSSKRITPNQMTQKTNTDIFICYNCYEYETHVAKYCTKIITICSNCSKIVHK